MNWSDINTSIQQVIHFQIDIGPLDVNPFKIILFFVLLAITLWTAKLFTKLISTKLLSYPLVKEQLQLRLQRALMILFFLLGFVATLGILGFDMTILLRLFSIFNFTLLRIGDTPIGLGSIIIFIFLIGAFTFASRILSALLVSKGLSRVDMDQGTKYVLKRITEYALITIGAVIAFQTVGINLSGLAVIFGLLSVGIGFGLQTIASNFISGVILLFERPIQVGDRISVGDTQGDVEEINIRATTIRSLDNISIIVPNTEFIEGRVTNWSHGDLKVRMCIAVGVSYDSDLENVLTALKEVAAENSTVLQTPQPEVLLMEFGDSSWNMELRVWIADPKDYYQILSDINCAVVHKFRERHIEIPFPQHDLHVRSPLPLPFDSTKN